MKIRKAHSCDSNTLCKLAIRSKAVWGYDTDFLEQCKAELNYNPAYISKHSVYVAEQEGNLVGFYSLEKISDTEVELGALFVEPGYIGKGFGRMLVQHAKAQATQQGFRNLTIQGDPHAEVFYEKMGAKKIGYKESSSIGGRMLPLMEIELGDQRGSRIPHIDHNRG